MERRVAAAESGFGDDDLGKGVFSDDALGDDDFGDDDLGADTVGARRCDVYVAAVGVNEVIVFSYFCGIPPTTNR